MFKLVHINLFWKFSFCVMHVINYELIYIFVIGNLH